MIVLLQVIQKGVVEGECLITVHGVVEIRLGAFQLVVEGELGDQQDFVRIVHKVAVPSFTLAVGPEFQLEKFLC
jgi:hypothetical protein